MSFSFSPDRQKRLAEMLERYPDKRSAALPALYLAQEQEGFLSSDTLEAVAQNLHLQPSEILDTVSFYTMFYTRPMGKYRLQVCQTLSCSLNGADELVDHLSNKLRIGVGETTPDGKYSLLKVECLGGCDAAPVVQINDDYHERLTPDKLDALLGALK